MDPCLRRGWWSVSRVLSCGDTDATRSVSCSRVVCVVYLFTSLRSTLVTEGVVRAVRREYLPESGTVGQLKM